MIVRVDPPMGAPIGLKTYWYAACVHCGWCSYPKDTELRAGDTDDAHLACKLERMLA